jgi:ribosomal protein L9
MAEAATPARVAHLEKLRQRHAAEEHARHEAMIQKLAELDGQTIKIVTKADEQGHLFKKLRGEDILVAIKAEKGIELPDDSVLLDEALATIGEHEVSLEHETKTITIKVEIEKEA